MAEQKKPEKESQFARAKAIGLKSTLRIGQDVIMTSFGNGNDAILEKKVVDNTVFDLNKDKPKFGVAPKEKEFALNGSLSVKPARSYPPAPDQGVDMLRAKDKLEQKYFGKTFDDNLHIQIIYNIIDIYKILAPYSTNIVYELGNITRFPGENERDYVGNFSAGKSYLSWLGDPQKNNDRKFLREFSKQKQLAYFGSVFQILNGNEKPDKIAPVISHNYAVLALIGTVRQICTHGYMSLENDSSRNQDARLFNLEELNGVDRSFITLLNDLYEKGVERINNGFRDNLKTNLTILHRMYPQKTLSDLASEYYDFAIRKSYKNLGFSIRTLREKIMELQDPCLVFFSSTACDSVRSKLNSLFDFALTAYYKAHPDKIGLMVDGLRAAANDDQKKESIYRAAAPEAWAAVSQTIGTMRPYMNETRLRALTSNKYPDPERVDVPARIDGMISGEGVPPFCKLIYMMTLFLNGKEINDLLTTLIHKFENIASFIDVINRLPGLAGSASFAKDYRMFAGEGSKKIARYLREINSFSRMQKILPKAKRTMYREALVLLGSDQLSDAELDAAVDRMLCLKPGPNGKMIKEKGGDTGFRNFIASNVIESSRFQYLIRYCNPKKVRALANNRELVLFQLRRLPPEQIERYYVACRGQKEDLIEKRITFLADRIQELNFRQFEKVKQNDRFSSRQEKEEKAKLQGMISLYLTILYQLVKGLVYVNSRYVMAFAALERDRYLMGLDRNDYLAVTKYFCDPENFKKAGQTCPINGRARAYLRKDREMANADMFLQFRNRVVHLNVIQSVDVYAGKLKKAGSYFGIYHYVLQRLIDDAIARSANGTAPMHLTPEAEKWTEMVKKTDVYCKDYVKALCTPFGYNLARFKNLSIEALFDMNEPKPTKEQGEIGETND